MNLVFVGVVKSINFVAIKKKDKEFHNSHESMTYVMKNKKKLLFCLHEDCNCSSQIIKSHSIQNNKILSKLSVNNHVYTISTDPNQIMGVDIKKCGKNDATTSTCFCLNHDTDIFKPIELKDYEYSEEQNFLYAYRAFSKAYYDKLDEQAAQQCIFAACPNRYIELGLVGRMRGTTIGVQENEAIRLYLNKALDERRFSAVETITITFDFEIQFATSYMCPMSYDLMGNQINDVWSMKDRMKNIFVSMFPENGKSYVLISWLDIDAISFLEVKEQFKSLRDNSNKRFLINTLNNMVACQSDNFAFNPKYFESWDKETKDNFLNEFKSFLIGSKNIENIGLEIEKRLVIFPCKFNLFKK